MDGKENCNWCGRVRRQDGGWRCDVVKNEEKKKEKKRESKRRKKKEGRRGA